MCRATELGQLAWYARAAKMCSDGNDTEMRVYLLSTLSGRTFRSRLSTVELYMLLAVAHIVAAVAHLGCRQQRLAVACRDRAMARSDWLRERIIFGFRGGGIDSPLVRWEHLGVPWVARRQQVASLGRGDADRGGLTRRSVGRSYSNAASLTARTTPPPP